ncbi:unnamed protein product [Prorocentrum cordatum]|uniref:Methyltransferase type 11 domain-containing protein n=1 Tax=Prorocentrum cordatum TaxID=2364126 RepID=A0ABN9R0X7_9DINO|nr:unnamed protein product [Polarella glacialis]
MITLERNEFPGPPRYWEHELRARPEHEWYGVGWESVRHLVPRGGRVLHLGCGSSSWPSAMAQDGYQEVVHVDGSAALVRSLRLRHPALRFEVMDAGALALESGSFDVALEKGLLDALLLSGLSGAHAAVEEVHRVLRPGGVFVSLTAYGGPGEEGPMLGAAPWASQEFVDVLPAGAGMGPVAYVCRKRAGAAAALEAGDGGAQGPQASVMAWDCLTWCFCVPCAVVQEVGAAGPHLVPPNGRHASPLRPGVAYPPRVLPPGRVYQAVVQPTLLPPPLGACLAPPQTTGSARGRDTPSAPASERSSPVPAAGCPVAAAASKARSRSRSRSWSPRAAGADAAAAVLDRRRAFESEQAEFVGSVGSDLDVCSDEAEGDDAQEDEHRPDVDADIGSNEAQEDEHRPEEDADIGSDEAQEDEHRPDVDESSSSSPMFVEVADGGGSKATGDFELAKRMQEEEFRLAVARANAMDTSSGAKASAAGVGHRQALGSAGSAVQRPRFLSRQSTSGSDSKANPFPALRDAQPVEPRDGDEAQSLVSSPAFQSDSD